MVLAFNGIVQGSEQQVIPGKGEIGKPQKAKTSTSALASIVIFNICRKETQTEQSMVLAFPRGESSQVGEVRGPCSLSGSGPAQAAPGTVDWRGYEQSAPDCEVRPQCLFWQKNPTGCFSSIINSSVACSRGLEIWWELRSKVTSWVSILRPSPHLLLPGPHPQVAGLCSRISLCALQPVSKSEGFLQTPSSLL